MIECKDILALCDRFEAYLMPLDVHILRQRYNGKVLKSTYAVARDMQTSDETVRTIENRALDALAHCVALEEAGQPITPMRLAKSFRQPVASMICHGFTKSTSAAVYTAHRGELVIFASSLGRPRDCTRYPYGALVGRVLLVDCYEGSPHNPHLHRWRFCFEQPEMFPEPIAYHGKQAFFQGDPEVARRVPLRDEYRY